MPTPIRRLAIAVGLGALAVAAVEAVSNESLHTTIDVTSARGKAHLTIDGKWIGAMCTDSD